MRVTPGRLIFISLREEVLCLCVERDDEGVLVVFSEDRSLLCVTSRGLRKGC